MREKALAPSRFRNKVFMRFFSLCKMSNESSWRSQRDVHWVFGQNVRSSMSHSCTSEKLVCQYRRFCGSSVTTSWSYVTLCDLMFNSPHVIYCSSFNQQQFESFLSYVCDLLLFLRCDEVVCFVLFYLSLASNQLIIHYLTNPYN